ncbi:MAG TPA: YdeI/OmpD-associated family protein [Candidatus Cloacimonadota bacterium]|nr:YdeI/OmpD-associated family protein [Candidatus Cloacimonadota bacterium]HPT71476.1 YdeI/OmpD-associated family protein [Candidatus Cloacimonadota bacterium]
MQFKAIILSPEDAPKAAYIELPFSALEVFGTKGRVPVKGTMDDYPYQGTLSPMGGCHIIGVNKEIRKAIHKDTGDTITVIMEKDEVPRTVEVPKDFQSALNAHPSAKAKFEQYSYSHKKELVTWINDCKKAETRIKRITKAIDSLT